MKSDFRAPVEPTKFPCAGGCGKSFPRWQYKSHARHLCPECKEKRNKSRFIATERGTFYYLSVDTALLFLSSHPTFTTGTYAKHREISPRTARSHLRSMSDVGWVKLEVWRPPSQGGFHWRSLIYFRKDKP